MADLHKTFLRFNTPLTLHIAGMPSRFYDRNDFGYGYDYVKPDPKDNDFSASSPARFCAEPSCRDLTLSQAAEFVGRFGAFDLVRVEVAALADNEFVV
jgi:hypothetical protein